MFFFVFFLLGLLLSTSVAARTFAPEIRGGVRGPAQIKAENGRLHSVCRTGLDCIDPRLYSHQRVT